MVLEAGNPKIKVIEDWQEGTLFQFKKLSRGSSFLNILSVDWTEWMEERHLVLLSPCIHPIVDLIQSILMDTAKIMLG